MNATQFEVWKFDMNACNDRLCAVYTNKVQAEEMAKELESRYYGHYYVVATGFTD